ncbi:MAG: hypothetical protein KGN79_03690 [Acidobacteriota bacterium]|nr:hypothetical protein [Acidobacteriota bacterium]
MKRHHEYHAEAHVFGGSFEHPLAQDVGSQAYVKLHFKGGYGAQRSSGFRLENVCSFRSAYTQVSGNPDPKPGHGWTTLVTAVVEGLNILDVVTADRIVAQISMEHPLKGYVPKVTFLGTRYENFCIAGDPICTDLNLNFFGSKPVDDMPYTRHPHFLENAARHCEAVHRHEGISAKLAGRYNQIPRDQENVEPVECSLVNKIEGVRFGTVSGNVIDVPDFGLIHLAGFSLTQRDFLPGTRIPQQTEIQMKMVEIQMGCIAGGMVTASDTIINGHTKP